VIRLYKNTLLFCGLLLTFPATAVLAGEVKSGYDYIKPESRAMQDDDFENPGMLAVEKGQVLFNQKQNGTDKACAECHGEGGENLNTKNIARYPVYSEDAAEIVTLQKRISRCRDNTSSSKPLPTDHPDLVNLEAELLQAGEQLYNTRYGLIDMACYHCHDLYPGQMIRGQKISQGQGNGFPAYRLGTGEITNLHQRIQQCLTLMRAEPFAADSDEINLLGLYIMSRSNGLRIETPAVRY
jgi:sulfur-oxidizing protein SoxA